MVKRELLEVTEILRMTGRSEKLPLVCTASLICFAAGAVIAALMGNLFLVPVMAVGMMFLPLWYVKLTANHFKNDIAAELETALSIITTAYLRNDDIVMAVEENIAYLNPPVKDVFSEFLTQLKLIDADVERAIKNLRAKTENEVFGDGATLWWHVRQTGI
jgi:Flp pilus assembly protein TadB